MNAFKPTLRFRPPPKNTVWFDLCESPENCLLGNACIKAHSTEELHEWWTRASQKERSILGQQPRTPVESLRTLITESRRLGISPKNVLTELSGGQSILCKQNLYVLHLDKNKEIMWEFTVETNLKSQNYPIRGLQNVFFLEKDSYEFSFSSLAMSNGSNECLNIQGNEISMGKYSSTTVTFAKITVKFISPSYGHFNVTVVFDFGVAPRIVRYVGVVVAPEKHLFEKLSSHPTSVSDSKHNELAWLKKYKLVSFVDSTKEESANESKYDLPANLKFGVEFGAFEYMDVNLTPDNYRDRLHHLLFVEEYERRKRMSRLSVHCADVFTVLGKRSKRAATKTVDVKRALFVPVSEEVLEEVGLLVSRGSKALIRLRQFVYTVDSEDYVIHEALVVNILGGEVVLEISSKTLVLLNTMTSPVPVDICFRFVNTFLCMHSAIDRVNLDLIFYQGLRQLDNKPNSLNGSPLLHSQLSPAQSAALSRILHSSPGPPVLLLGPFGTGKTKTLAEAVKMLTFQPIKKYRILICTHSNSAADHYIEDYLHPIFKEHERADPGEKPLRLYWEHRLATTISDTMLPYCIMDLSNGTFRMPSMEELERKPIIVTTLVTADMLVKCGVKPGFFTHIFIDEAAQAMEVETIIPLSLATDATQVVLAGDHLQLGPPVFSNIGRKLMLDKSLLVRLYESYPANSPRKILLLENFRSFPEIVDIPSKLFYEGSLVAKKRLPADLQYPVMFYGVPGFEEKAEDSPSYVNMAEVAEITERVEEMINTWPSQHFGELQLERTCVLCAHYAQMRQIRRELRVHGFSAVRVENVNNVQGLEFDVLFLSIVRTSRMLGPGQHEGKDLGFLSNPKLLNTAITRAKFCLVVVGDPMALCSVGDCRVCWKTILSLCSENGTFHYRVPLTQVLSSIRHEQSPTVVPCSFNNRSQIPSLQPYGAVPNPFPFLSTPMDNMNQVHFMTPSRLPLLHSIHLSPNIPVVLATQLPYQPQIHVSATSNGPVRSQFTGNMENFGICSHASDLNTVKNHCSIKNVYSQSESMKHPAHPSLNCLPTAPNSYRYVADNHRTDSTRTLQPSTETGMQRASPPRARLPTPHPYQNPLPTAIFNYCCQDTGSNITSKTNMLPIFSGSERQPKLRPISLSTHHDLAGKNVVCSMENLTVSGHKKSQQVASTKESSLPQPSSEKSALPFQLDSGHQYSTHNGAKPQLQISSDVDVNITGSHLDEVVSSGGRNFPEGIDESGGLLLSAKHKILEESPILSLCQTLRHTIAGSLRNITKSEEAVNVLVENPLGDVTVEIRQNLVSQLALIQKQKSSLEQQQVLNRIMTGAIQERRKQLNSDAVRKVGLLVDDCSMSPRLTHVRKINLDDDDEVQEWYHLRRKDPIVQDYIKSFEILLERAKSRGNEDESESCDISDVGMLGRSLRGWVLQPESAVYFSGYPLYEEHISREKCAKMIENGELTPCTLLVDKSSKGKSATCVVDDPLQKNILIPDRQSMNRAFHTDYVAVEVTLDLEDKDLREGKVVSILQEKHHRQVVCQLSCSQSTVMIPLNNSNPNFSILQSANHAGQTGVAVFDTHGDQLHFQRFVSDVQDKLFLIQFLKWDISYRYPLGFVVKCFDRYTDLNSFLPVLCADYGILNDFPADVTEESETCFPESWRLPDEELRSRLRYEDAFTIDCEGAEELDDAISVRLFVHGIYSVTVHVADVSYFVSKGSSIDKAAQERATSLYVQPSSNLSLPLLPKRLRHICSLLPGRERLAVSIEFIIDSSGKILRSPIHRRSVVVSQRQFSFAEVDGFLSELNTATPSVTSSPLLQSIKILYFLTHELWARRARSGSFQACVEASLDSPSRRMVEELMVLTNTAIAEKLSKLPDSHVAPFRVQQLPRYGSLQKLTSWASESHLNLSEMWFTQFLTGYQEQESPNSSPVSFDLKTWQGICQAVKMGSLADLTEQVVAWQKNCPIITRLKRLLPRSKYVSSSQYSSTEREHFSLKAECYTHFTSPMRRYLDIVAHRVLLTETTTPLYDDVDMEELCNTLNLRCGKAAAFSKQCRMVCDSESLRGTDLWRTMEIDSVESDCITLKNSENHEKYYSDRKVKATDMGATMFLDGVHYVVACWTFYDVNLNDERHHDLENNSQASAIVSTQSSSTALIPHDSRGYDGADLSKMFEQGKPPSTDWETKTVLQIPSKLWCELLQAIKKEDIIAVVQSMEAINKHPEAALRNEASSKLSIAINTSGYHVVKRAFKRGDKLQALFTCSSSYCLPHPSLRAVRMLPGKICCIQHHRQPVECFCEKAKIPVRERYLSVEEYQRINIPLLMIESAEKSIRTGISSIHFKAALVTWVTDVSNDVHGHFQVPSERLPPNINIHQHDFVCVSTETQVVSHGRVNDVVLRENDYCVHLVVNSDISKDLPATVNIEIISQCHSYRRMITAVKNLPQTSEDIRSLFLTRDLHSPVKQSRPKGQLISSFLLDASQRKAVNRAINSSFTVIEGRSGTGKTYCAAAIAEQFYLYNSCQKSTFNVLLCSPTEQALNDVENMLSRVSALRVLRVYDRETEAMSFQEIEAVYGVHPKSSATDVLSHQFALHFKIRSNSNPFHKAILKYAENLLDMLKQDENREQICRVVANYKELVEMAEAFELEQSGINIVLCTCIEAGRMEKLGRIKQCIIDNSHHCLEAETLVALQAMSTCCERIVLLGESSLEETPVVQNNFVRSFGLNRSLFHALSRTREKKRIPRVVLDKQHRMLGL